MPEYLCTFPDCDKAFARAYELKKHMVYHEDPDSLFHCPDCDFITLQNKNLRIHRATHTGEKIHQCPHMIDLDSSPDSPARTERCEYRTNDPAALTKHRKKVHAYIPLPSRIRPPKVTAHKPHQKKNGRPSRHPPLSPLCRKPSHVVRQADSMAARTAHGSTSSESFRDSSHFLWPGNMQTNTSDASVSNSSSFTRAQELFRPSTAPNNSDVAAHDSSPFLWQGDIDAYGRLVDRGSSFTAGPNRLVSHYEPPPVSPYESTRHPGFYDPLPSFQSQWVPGYEQSYTTFDQPVLQDPPEPVQAAPITPASLHILPEYNLGSRDQPLLSTHNWAYTLGA